MSNGGLANCSAEGVQYLSSEATEASVCAAFERRVSEALQQGDASAKADNLSVTLRFQKRGTMEASIVATNGDKAYPPIAIDVVDRSLAMRDLDRLADAVAKMLMDT
ncbi:hypothetical protein [Parerythrobacter aestuarii]|uniref:hypothetical protein n=1 Tax=Parerythrobacter aestuarii TaxID=3020909 RepID=UPI0024DE850B|nr:hypothetical protein [Parerythrobacter aestuarii]